MPVETVRGRVVTIHADGSIRLAIGGATIEATADLITALLRTGDLCDVTISYTNGVGTLQSITPVQPPGGISASGYIQNASVDVTIPGLSTGSYVVTWPHAWSNALYDVTVSLHIHNGSVASLDDLRFLGISDLTTTQATIAIRNLRVTPLAIHLHAIGVKQ